MVPSQFLLETLKCRLRFGSKQRWVRYRTLCRNHLLFQDERPPDLAPPFHIPPFILL